MSNLRSPRSLRRTGPRTAVVLAVALLAPSSVALPPTSSIAGDWVTTTSVAWSRYTEDWSFVEVGSGTLAQLVADAADGELSDSALVERIVERIEANLDLVTEGTPLSPGDIPPVLEGKLPGKVVDRLREALAEPDPHAFWGEYAYFDQLYPNVSIRGNVLVVQAGKHHVGVYREKEVHENINDSGDTLVKRLYGILDVKLFSNGVMFQAKGVPLSETGFQWTELAVRPEIVPTQKTAKKGKKKRKGWTVATPHGRETPLFDG